jgi:hypothetical protein
VLAAALLLCDCRNAATRSGGGPTDSA